MKETIVELTAERKQLMERVKKIDNAIEAFQKVCEHKDDKGKSAFVHTGHDSHKNYHACSVCGYEDDY